MAKGRNRLTRVFGELYPVHVRAFTSLLIALRRDFSGDLDMLLVLAVIGDRRLSRRTTPDALTYQQIGRTPVREDGIATINALSIAEYTGIPRETVRRKVNELIQKGWVTRDDNGDLVPTPKAAQDLAQSTDATLDYLGTIIEAGEKLGKP
jgi:hypothetical protein